MFIGRRPDGSVYGCWSCQQPRDADHPGIEELPDNHPDVVAFNAPPAPGEPPITVEALFSAMEKKGGIPTRAEVLAETGKDAIDA